MHENHQPENQPTNHRRMTMTKEHKPAKELMEKEEPTLNGIPISEFRAAPRKVREAQQRRELTLNGIPASQLRAAPRKVWEAQQRRERIKRLDARLEEHREIFENRNLWVGPYEFYLQSDDWKATRTMKLLSVDFYCEECSVSLVVPACRSIHPLFFKDSADIHHLHYRTIGKEALEDLQALCRPCHHSIHVNRGW